MKDNRRSIRLAIEMPASFKVSPGQAHTSLAMINEMSALGFSMTTPEPLTVGLEFDIQIRFNDSTADAVPVKVVWVRQMDHVEVPEYRAGVKLLESLSEPVKKYIHTYVGHFMKDLGH